MKSYQDSKMELFAYKQNALKDIMKRWDLTCAAAADIMGVEPQTVRLWRQNGKRKTPVPMDLLLCLYRYFNTKLPERN